MTASLEDVNSWIAEAKEMGATHIISVCDTFSWDDYPIFIMPTDELDKKVAYYQTTDMQQVNEVIEIK